MTDLDRLGSSYRIALAGRSKLLTVLPSGQIGTPEKQVFAQIYDTLVCLGPDLAFKPCLGSFHYDEKGLSLRISWRERFFHDGSRVTAGEVVRCLRASAPKFSGTIPRSRQWFGQRLKEDTEESIAFSGIVQEELKHLLRLLSLPDFGIYQAVEHGAKSAFPVIGTGPYRFFSAPGPDAPSIELIPFEGHPQRERALDHLDFVAVALNECSAQLKAGYLDEYLTFGMPTDGLESGGALVIPSLRANLGLLLFNLRSSVFGNHRARKEFASAWRKAVCASYFDDSWAVPRSLVPPGFAGHGTVDYLRLPEEDGPDPSPLEDARIRIGVTNSRQARRLERIFSHPAFESMRIQMEEYPSYAMLRTRASQDPGLLDCGFLAIRNDRGEESEFFEFLDASHPTSLFQQTDPTSLAAYSKFSRSASSESVRELEETLLERLVCLPIGYYYDIRVVSPRQNFVIGLCNHDGPPRYLKVLPAEIMGEVHLAQRTLQSLWEQFSSRRVEQKLAHLVSRAAHDLKSPLAALKVVAQDPRIDDGMRAILKSAVARISNISKSGLSLNDSTPSELRAPTSEKLNPVDLVHSAVAEVTAYANPGVRFHIIRDEGPIEIEPIRIPKCDLSSLVVNLLKNSVEALSGRQQGNIRIRLKSAAPLVLEVVDDGPGFSEEAQRAFHANRYYTSKPGGSGLGLAQSNRILQGVGGNLSIENIAQGGALVRMEVPVVSGAVDQSQRGSHERS